MSSYGNLVDDLTAPRAHTPPPCRRFGETAPVMVARSFGRRSNGDTPPICREVQGAGAGRPIVDRKSDSVLRLGRWERAGEFLGGGRGA
jgi:hypothetical protein